MRAALAAVALLTACAHDPAVPLQSPMAWTSPADDLAVRVDLARAMVDSDRPEAALDIVRKARADGLAGPDLSVVQARALIARGLAGEAETLLEEVVRRDPRNAGAHAALGGLHLDQGHLDLAVADLERAARLAPDEARMHNNLGFALLAAGRYAEAEPALRRALRLDPSNARARNNLGFTLAALCRTEEARETFRAVVGDEGAERNLRIAAHSCPSTIQPLETP